MRTHSIKIAVAAVAACFWTTAFAQDWADWDLDEDRAYSEEEFGAGLGESGIFNTFDTEVDNLVSEDEWLAEFGDDAEMDHDWNEWDDDRDAFYNEEEFGAGMFSRFDADESGYLDEDEVTAFGEAGEDAGWFE